MLRVLFNNPNPGLHGGPATHLPLLKAALERYVEVESFRHGRATDSETTARKMLQTALNLGMVESKILRRRPDIIHVNSSFNARGILRDAPLAWVAKRHAIPVVLKAHGSFLEVIRPTQKLVETAKKSLIRNISLLCVLSSAEKQEFEELLPELRGRVSVVKNIISDRFLNAERRESDQPLVLFASRFLKEKGPFDLLDAVPNIVARIPEARFVFLGDGPDASAFDAEINKRGVGTYVQRMPHADRNEIASWYTRSWVFVFPTLFPEGMPMVIAEAMATGTPIVMTQIRFGLSYMAEYDNCLYCKPRNPESIAQQVIRLLTDSAMRQKMSQANRILALQFETEAVAREFVQIYEMLASAAEGKPVSVGTGSGRLFKS